MSRVHEATQETLHRFPRVSGDEPALQETVETLQKFSPRERG